MEIQEPTLRTLVAYFGWPMAPRFPDVRGIITEVLRDATGDLEAWSWDAGPGVAAWNEDRRLHLLATPRGIDVISEYPEHPAPVARAVLAGCLEALAIEKPATSGAGASWLLAASSLADAAAAIETTMGHAELRNVLEPLGGRPDRISVDTFFEEEGGSTRLVVRPHTAEELIDDEFLSDLEPEDVPPTAIYARISRVREEPSSIEGALETSARSSDAIQKAGSLLLPSLMSASQ